MVEQEVQNRQKMVFEVSAVVAVEDPNLSEEVEEDLRSLLSLIHI